MKKIMLLVLVIIVASTSVFATNKRIQALGNNAYMIPGDDASIQLFPQRINDMNLIYFEDIHTANPNYLLVVGEPGKTWGFYGGATQQDDYFNVIRSLGKTAAVRMGLRFGITSQTDIEDDKETTPTVSEEKLSQTNLMLDMEFGKDMEDMEFSTLLTFGITPANITSLLGFAPTPHGSYTGDFENAGTSVDAEGSASRMTLAFMAKARSNKGLFIFDNSYAVFGFGYQGTASEFTNTANTKIEDATNSILSMHSTYRLFNNQNLADDKIFIVYGMGGAFYFDRRVIENKIKPGESTSTDMNFAIVSPIINLGLEAKLKYATLRFGMERMLTTLGYSAETQTYDAGTNNDEDSYSQFTLGGNGSYNYTAGMGFHYGDLQLDILLNNNFWMTGPQMIFNDLYGTIGVCADLVYTF